MCSYALCIFNAATFACIDGGPGSVSISSQCSKLLMESKMEPFKGLHKGEMKVYTCRWDIPN